MDDISPELLEKLKNNFNERISASSEIAELEEKIRGGNASYRDTERYSVCVGEALSGAFGDELSSGVLPDGHMYYNIGQKTVIPMLHNGYDMVSDAAADTQKALNTAAGLHLQVQKPEFNEDRAHGLIDHLDKTERYEDAAWILGDQVVNFAQSVVDDAIEANVDFHAKIGLSPKIVREAEPKCCDWCRNLEGTYDYPVAKEVYQRHENCRCVIEYHPGDGRVQNAHTKKWAQLVAKKAAEKRKELHEGSAGDKILERIQTATEKAARPKYNKHYVEKTLQSVGFDIDNSFFRNVDKNLQMSVADQLEILEKKFNGVTNTQGTMGLLYDRGKTGAAVGVAKEPITRSTRLKLGTSFKSWDDMMDTMAHEFETGHCMPFANDSQNRARYMVTHEYGHIMENMFIAEDRERLLGNYGDFTRRYVDQIETIAKSIDQDYSREKYLSGYGKESQDPAEFFAECFANSQMGAPNVLGEAMNKWLEQRGY